MFITKPSWYDAFSCLAGRCPDTCCGAWQVEIDERSLALYRSVELNGTPLGTVPKGATVHVFAFNDRCAYVDYEGHRGFVALRALKKTD